MKPGDKTTGDGLNVGMFLFVRYFWLIRHWVGLLNE
jgi:hypothetical protein